MHSKVYCTWSVCLCVKLHSRAVGYIAVYELLKLLHYKMCSNNNVVDFASALESNTFVSNCAWPNTSIHIVWMGFSFFLLMSGVTHVHSQSPLLPRVLHSALA